MNDLSDFLKYGHEFVEWLGKYYTDVEKFPVCSISNVGDIERAIPASPPESSESYGQILEDIEEKIMPGLTHWQSPNYFGYFPANSSYPSVLAELITAGLGIQGMKWLTSPAATELEKVMMRWLQQMLGLSDDFKGVIMDTASVSTLCAILAAREKVTNYKINEEGFSGQRLRIYCSYEAHSSIEKAVRIAGIGSNNLVKIETDNTFRLKPDVLRTAIESDLKKGFLPACVIAAYGTTGSGAVDPIGEIAAITRKHSIWLHVDAAYSGTSLIVPEFRTEMSGIQQADSFVFNPHKWMFTNFDCSTFFVKSPKDLINTFSLVPPYLQTASDTTDIDFSNWGIQLGRRFRALKLWFVIRHFGVEGLQKKIRFHVELGGEFEQYIKADHEFELLTKRNLNIVCFRYIGNGEYSADELNLINEKLLDKINKTGKIFLTHTIFNNTFAIRFVCGQTRVEERHVSEAWRVIKQAAETLESI